MFSILQLSQLRNVFTQHGTQKDVFPFTNMYVTSWKNPQCNREKKIYQSLVCLAETFYGFSAFY